MDEQTEKTECPEFATCELKGKMAELDIKNNLGTLVLSIAMIIATGIACSLCDIIQNNSICDIIQTILMLCTAIVAICALNHGRKSLEAQNVCKINEEYGQESMYKALEALGELLEEKREILDDIRKNHNKEGYSVKLSMEERKDIENRYGKERRKVKFFFINILNLYKAGYLRNKAFRILMDKNGIVLLFHVVEPLEYLKKAQYDREPFKTIKELCIDIYEKHCESNK